MDDKTTNNNTSISAAAAAIVAATLAATCSNNGSLSLNNIATSSSSNNNSQLCVNDLLHPTAKAESLLEALTTEQLNVIEQTLNKIREKKHLTEDIHTTAINTPATTSTITTTTLSPPTTTTPATAMLSNVSLPTPPPAQQDEWARAANQVAKALADAISAVDNHTVDGSNKEDGSNASQHHHEPVTEIRDGVEWVSFVYSHHRILRRYCIRTDLDKVDIQQLDDKFKRDNCVYPRANLPRETYRGNRWAYETECNMLGWKLAYLNANEIAGKRGLIQRAVDSYRNRYPSMRSRRVARQEKLMNGTLRKRKHRDCSPEEPIGGRSATHNAHLQDDNLLKQSFASISPSQHEAVAAAAAAVLAAQQQQQQQQQPQRNMPKTISIDDGSQGSKCRIRINIETVPLEMIDMAFRKNNCVFPRAINIAGNTQSATQRQLDEAKCNELGWKLAWLNPRQLANRKSLLQRVLDIYRIKFAPHLRPRKYASRMPPAPFAPPPRSHDCSNSASQQVPLKLTAETLAAQQEQLAAQDPTSGVTTSIPSSSSSCAKRRRLSESPQDDQESIYSGTTASLDFRDCFSPPAEAADSPFFSGEDVTTLPDMEQSAPPPPPPPPSSSSTLLLPSSTAEIQDFTLNDLMLPASRGDLMLCQGQTDNDAMSVAMAAAAAAAASAAASSVSNLKTPCAPMEIGQDDMSCQLSVESCSTGSSSSNPSNQSSPRHGPTTTGLTLSYPPSIDGNDLALFGQPDEVLKKYLEQVGSDTILSSFMDPQNYTTETPVKLEHEDDDMNFASLTTDCLLDQLF
ncbi:hypothetical protein K492DRAFT_172694 [Lichtheimia hyalospora FSU 10163]|nr:hypothetical protein K492DRAFT_172694 [Lichtheimia hyalospora FSU 10163]